MFANRSLRGGGEREGGETILSPCKKYVV